MNNKIQPTGPMEMEYDTTRKLGNKVVKDAVEQNQPQSTKTREGRKTRRESGQQVNPDAVKTVGRQLERTIGGT